MAATDQIPAELTQGCNLSATVGGGDYPATTYTGALTLFNGTTRVTGTVAASGGDYLCSLTTTQTAAMAPGAWTWQLFASSGSTRVKIDEGRILILPDLAENQIPAYDPRSSSRKRLETFEKLMGDANYLKTLTPDEIANMELVRKQAYWDVQREDDAMKLKAGGYPTRKIFTRFV